MTQLHDDLEMIRKLNELRERAKELRQRGLRPLQKIKNIDSTPKQKTLPKIETVDSADSKIFDKWFSSGNEVEVSLLMKIKNNPDISLNEDDNKNAGADEALYERIRQLTAEDFFPKLDDLPSIQIDSQPTVPVLMAARIMQSLTRTAKTVFSEHTMLCYYRIIRELYVAGDIDFTFGAARAGAGAGTSAFVTGECVRAIFSLKDSINRTVKYLENTRQFYLRFEQLVQMLEFIGVDPYKYDFDKHPIKKWANRVLERIWLDCYLATNPRAGQISIFSNDSDETEVNNLIPNQLLLFDSEEVSFISVERYFDSLALNLRTAIEDAKKGIKKAKNKIKKQREDTETPFSFHAKDFKNVKSFAVKLFNEKLGVKTDKNDKLVEINGNPINPNSTKLLSAFIFSQLSTETKELIESTAISNLEKEKLAISLVREINVKLLKIPFENENPDNSPIPDLSEKLYRENNLLNGKTKDLKEELAKEVGETEKNKNKLIELNLRVLENAYPDEIKKNQVDSKISEFQRSESSHLIAIQIIENAFLQAKESMTIIDSFRGVEEKKIEKNKINSILKALITQCEELSHRIHKVVMPTKQYIKNVIRRELSAWGTSNFDAGELVFAATAYGEMTSWKPDELLTRACDLLKESLPESGRLLTKRPVHSTPRGYRLLPIGCEMTRSLAHLFQKNKYEVDPRLVSRMLNIFEDKLIEVSNEKGKEMIGWNFDGSPNPSKPSVWVTCVVVLSLDRIVRMLNARINEAVLKHFDVFRPEKPHVELTLNDLIYPDVGFNEYFYKDFQATHEHYEDLQSISITLELMRAHVMRVNLPKKFVKKKECKIPLFSAIFYGPPGTGKTTLAEALALSANVPVVTLSPNDLLVEGQELIEGRARDVFEALSMLTQTVIILDEFESVLESRRMDDEGNTNKFTVLTDSKQAEVKESGSLLDSTNSSKGVSNNEDIRYLQLRLEELTNELEQIKQKNKTEWQAGFDNIAKEIKEISKKDDPKFQFLLAGMLPRLLKLHDIAKNQSLVYCLATNYLKKIDDAAKRTGRFDFKIPVYNPGPLSRAGTLLFRLNRVVQTLKQKGTEKTELKPLKQPKYEWKEMRERFLEVLAHTTNEPASELSGRYFKVEEKNEQYSSKSKYLNYILGSKKDFNLDFEKWKKIENLCKDESKLESFEIDEIKWLEQFEKNLVKNEVNGKVDFVGVELESILSKPVYPTKQKDGF